MNILWLPHAPWHVPQRAHHFLAFLARRHQVWVTDWDGDFRRPRDVLSKRYLANPFPRRWVDGGIVIQHVPRISPALYFRALRRLNDAIYRSTVQRLVARAGIDVVVGCFVAPVPAGVPTVADVFDDNVGLWLEDGGFPGFVDEIRVRERAWIVNSRATVAVSSVLAERLRADHPDADVEHISNGVDTSYYVPARHEARTALQLDPDRKYVGNVGRVSNPREVRRLVAVAERLESIPGVEMLVVGDGPEMPRLERELGARGLAHVHLLGFAAGDTLLHYFQALDVGLCPYDRTTANDARVPMRLLHYSAVGATVVCTALEEVARLSFGNVVFSDAAPQDFADAVVRGLDRSGEVPARIVDYDIGSLARRYEAILERVRQPSAGPGRRDDPTGT